jgi:hypothetical protein
MFLNHDKKKNIVSSGEIMTGTDFAVSWSVVM